MERDRLRELLDAVLDEGNTTLEAMAGTAYASPFHFARQVGRGAGEPPVALRRRVMLERAAWQLQQGGSVTDTAFAAGYESVDGFARAFGRAYGHPPSGMPRTASHWLPAPNGIHFHPPGNLWVDGGARPGDPVTALLVQHDLDDVRGLLEAAKGLSQEAYEAVRMPGHTVLAWDGPDETLAQVLGHLVHTRSAWLAAIEGTEQPPTGGSTPADLIDAHEDLSARWLAVVRDIDRRGAWGDRVVDALCEPPESFVLASIVAHVLTFSAHRRLLARSMLARAGVPTDDPDPILWLRRRTGGPA